MSRLRDAAPPPRVARAGFWPHRLRVALLLACGVLFACHYTRDEKSQEARRRVLLLAQDLDKKRRDAYEKVRIETETGDLVPSNTTVAGLTLPRGLTATFQLDHAWYFDGPLALPKLEKYFRERLDITQERHPNNATLEFTAATVRGNVLANPVTLQLLPQPGRSDRSTIVIREHVPVTAQGTPEQVLERLRARQRYAR